VAAVADLLDNAFNITLMWRRGTRWLEGGGLIGDGDGKGAHPLVTITGAVALFSTVETAAFVEAAAVFFWGQGFFKPDRLDGACGGSGGSGGAAKGFSYKPTKGLVLAGDGAAARG
jgi:hypothetical protein